MSWLGLLLATLGLTGAAVVGGAVVFGEVTRTTLRVGAAAVAVVAFLAFAGSQVYQTAKFLNAQRLTYRGLSSVKARDKCLLDGGDANQVDFLDFVRRTTPSMVRYVVAGPLPSDPACLSFVLSPRLMEAGVREAAYVIFTSGVPAGWMKVILPGSLQTFSPSRAVARLPR